MGRSEVEAFLTMLANERKVSTSTHRQALHALLFLYKQVLGQDLPWLNAIGRPLERKRILVVLTPPEVQTLLALLDGMEGLLARTLYGTGMRLAEGLSLRVKECGLRSSRHDGLGASRSDAELKGCARRGETQDVETLFTARGAGRS